MSCPRFIYTYKFGDTEATATVSGGNLYESKRKLKDALGFDPADRQLVEVKEILE